jgi:hypothetical protein
LIVDREQRIVRVAPSAATACSTALIGARRIDVVRGAAVSSAHGHSRRFGDDNLLVREGCASSWTATPASRWSPRSVTRHAGEACDNERPDVVVTDIRMPPTQTDEDPAGS